MFISLRQRRHLCTTPRRNPSAIPYADGASPIWSPASAPLVMSNSLLEGIWKSGFSAFRSYSQSVLIAAVGDHGVGRAAGQGDVNPGLAAARIRFGVFAEAPVAPQTVERPLDDPTPGQVDVAPDTGRRMVVGSQPK